MATYTLKLPLVLCPIKVRKVNIRLLDPDVDDYVSEGIVQVEYEGKWGYVCPSNWTPVNSYVFCGQLGFPNTLQQESYSETIQDVEPVYWLDQVTCKGWESSIVSCDHSGWGLHQCDGSRVLKIKCVRRRILKVSRCAIKANTIKHFRITEKNRIPDVKRIPSDLCLPTINFRHC